MSSKTKILVVKLKEIIYTVLFVVLGIILIVLLFILITGKSHKKDTSPVSVTTYSPGVYTSSIVLASNPVDIEVVVDDTQIKSVNLVNPSESVETMYPLISSSLSDIASQVIKNNSTENITYSQDARYTSIVLIGAINDALEKAKK